MPLTPAQRRAKELEQAYDENVTAEAAREIIMGIVEALYGEELDPDREWSPDDLEEIAALLQRWSLVPEE